MEVLIPTAPVEFNFDSSTTSPYISAPSSPQRFGAFFFSAPTSPTKASAFYKDFSSLTQITDRDRYVSGVPFDWEVTPGTPKSMDKMSVATDEDEDEDEDSRDFAFDFSSHMETCSLTADELFDGGKIKPLKPPPRLQFYEGKMPGDSWSPKSPRSPKKLIKDALSPRHKQKDFDPFAAAHEQTCRESSSIQGHRGRERTNNSSSIRNSSSSRQKKTRSLSPYRVSDLLIDSQDQVINQEGNANANTKQNSLFPSSPSFSSFWYKKWNLKDLLLFRSASEGRASSSKDQMKKYAMLKRNQQEDMKNSSFRSTDSIGSTTSSSSSRRRGPVSAHEMLYTANRAVAEEMKKKTFLPYKRSLLGCMGFSSGMPIHEISKGLGSLHRSRG